MEEEIIIPENPGGVLEKMDPRNHKYGAIFGEEANLPRKFILQIPAGFPVPYQGSIPCCVICSFTFINQWYSWMNDNNKINLSFRKPFADTGKYNEGRSLYPVAEYEKSKGQPQDKFCPNNIALPPAEFMKADLTPEGIADAALRKIGPYSWPETQAEIMSSIFTGNPVILTSGGNNTDWRKEIIKLINPVAWYHAYVVIGWDLDLGIWYAANWWKDGIRKIDINYPLTGALSFRDLPDGDKQTMIKTVRVAGKVDVYAINGNQKNLIPDSDTFHYFKGVVPILADTIEISQAELDQYTEGETMPSVLLMRTLGPVVPNIFLKERDVK